MTLFWGGVWYITVKNDPEDDEWISEEERNYIKQQMESGNGNKDKLVYPWKDLLTCVPFWMGCLVKFAYGVGFAFMMMNLPQYIKGTHKLV